MVIRLNLMNLMENVSANEETCKKFASFLENAKTAIQRFTMYKAAKKGGRPSEIRSMNMKMPAGISLGSLWDEVEKYMRFVANDLNDLNNLTNGTLVTGSVNPTDFYNLTECIGKVKNFLWNTRRMQMEDYSSAILGI